MTSELLQKNLLGKSDTQTITEKIVRDQISKKWGIEFESGILEINDTKFQVDFFNKQQMIYGEIYAGIDFLKPGQTRKVAMDILKLLTIEKLMSMPIQKHIAFIDPAIERKFKSSTWYSMCLKVFDVQVMTITLTADEISAIRISKKNQYR